MRVGRTFAFHFSSANISWAPACARHRAEPWECTDTYGQLLVMEIFTVQVGDRPPTPALASDRPQPWLCHLPLESHWENYLTSL